MIFTETFRSYLESRAFLEPLGLPEGTALDFSPLGQGEYHLNYQFTHPVTGQKLVLRINTGSQMHLVDQIGYEFSVLQGLLPSGRTPRPLFCDSEQKLLVMEWLPGVPLQYETDLPIAAHILADIHCTPVPENTRLLCPPCPARAIYEECLEMAGQYFGWEKADRRVAKLLDTLIREIGRLPLDEPSDVPRCCVNTELNSGNFLIDRSGTSRLVDWEKPLLSEPAQDLGHFLAPTTTFWKADVILTPEQVKNFTDLYIQAINGRMDCSSLPHRLPLFFTVTCLRGVTWCAMALREYFRPQRPLTHADTLKKLHTYLEPTFLEHLLEQYVRRNFLKDV